MVSDGHLLEEIKAGNYEAFATVVERYQTAAVNYCLRHTGDRYAAEDLAQEAFARLFIHRQTIEVSESGTLKPWLFHVLRNLCIDYNRKASGFVWVPFEEKLLPDDATHKIDWLSPALLDSLKEALRLLSPEQREAIYLATIEQLPYGDIARVMNRSVTSVKVLIHRARKRLRRNEGLQQYLKEVGIHGR